MLSAENQSNSHLKRNYYIRILNGLKMCFCFNFLIPNIPLTTSWIRCTFICNQSWMVSNVQSVDASRTIDKYPWNTTVRCYWILKVWVNHLFKYNIRDSHCVVIEFTSTSAISTLHTKVVKIWDVLETTSCDKVCQRLVASRIIFPHQ
jgi:hypothetical protein